MWSHTKLMTALSCSMRFHWSYSLGMRKVFLEPNPRLRGSAVHFLIAKVLENPENLNSIDTLLRGWAENYLPESGQPIMFGNSYRVSDEWAGFYTEVIEITKRFFEISNILQTHEVYMLGDKAAVELEIEALGAVARIDAILIEKETGRLQLVDFKVRSRFNTDLGLDAQLPLYALMLWQLDTPVQDIIQWQVKAAYPKKPKRNKSDDQGKRVSRAKITTTWSIYKETVLEYGDDPELYYDVRELLNQQEFVSYWHLPLVRSMSYYSLPALMSNWHKKVVLAENITALPPAVVQGRMCEYCDFAILCEALIRGEKVDPRNYPEYEVKK